MTDRALRPSDADRERFVLALDTARAEGRISSHEYTRRVQALRQAGTVDALDAVVSDLPGPASSPVPEPRRTGGRWVATILVGLLVGGVAGGAVAWARSASPTGPDDTIAGAPPVEEADAPEPTIDMYAPGEMERMLDALADVGATAYNGISIGSDGATISAQVSEGAVQYDTFEYDAEGLGAPSPGGTVAESVFSQFFTRDDFDPAVIATIADQADDIAGIAGRKITGMRLDLDDGVVVISVSLESDAYGSGASLAWDGTGQHLLRDGTD